MFDFEKLYVMGTKMVVIVKCASPNMYLKEITNFYIDVYNFFEVKREKW